MLSALKDSGLRWLWLSLIVVIVDQASKLWVLDNMALYETISVLPFFNLFHAHNYGAAFSFLHDAQGWQRWFFVIIAVAISALLLVWMRKSPASERLLPAAYALVIGGALGNLYDRLVYGYVVDMIQVFYQDWYYPTFNIADSAICIGGALLIFDAFRTKPQEVTHG